MAQLDKTSFEGTYNSSSVGLFKDNTSNAIGADDARSLVTDIKDSFLNKTDESYTGVFPQFTTATSTTAYTGTPSPAITAYATGQKFQVKVHATSTGAATLALNGLAAKKWFKSPTEQATTNDLVIDQIYIVAYDEALDAAAGGFILIGSAGGWPLSGTEDLDGNVTINLAGNDLSFNGGASTARVILSAENNVARIFSFRTNNVHRFAFRVDGDETGSDAGGDFFIRRYDDAGNFIDAPISIIRSTGLITISGPLKVTSGTPGAGKVLTSDADGDASWETPGGGGHTIEEEGTPLTQRTKLNFVGAGVTATDDSGDDATVVTIPGPGAIVGVQDMFIPSTAMWPRVTNGCSVVTKEEVATSLFNIQYLAFDQTTQEFCNFQFVAPRKWNNGTITAVFYWTALSGSGGVQWGIRGGAYSNDDPLSGGVGTAQTADDTLITALDVHISPETPAITIEGSPAAGDFLGFTISRNPAAGPDTLNADALLLGVSLRFTTNAAIDG